VSHLDGTGCSRVFCDRLVVARSRRSFQHFQRLCWTTFADTSRVIETFTVGASESYRLRQCRESHAEPLRRPKSAACSSFSNQGSRRFFTDVARLRSTWSASPNGEGDVEHPGEGASEQRFAATGRPGEQNVALLNLDFAVCALPQLTEPFGRGC